MRWDKLFDDLESQLERELTAEEIDLEAEEERLRLGRLGIRERLVAMHGQAASDTRLTVILTTGERVVLHPVTFGRDWLSADLVDDSVRRSQCILPFSAIAGLVLDSAQAHASLAAPVEEAGHPSLPARLGLGFVLRDLCRRRRSLDVVLVSGALHGTLDRIGRDHLDLAVHEPGTVRRASEVREIRVVPFAALVMLRL